MKRQTSDAIERGSCQHAVQMSVAGPAQMTRGKRAGKPRRNSSSSSSPDASERENGTDVLMLKELGNTKEQLSRLLDRERLSTVQKVDDSSEEGAAFARGDGRLVEDSGFLDDGRLVVHCRMDIVMYGVGVRRGRIWVGKGQETVSGRSEGNARETSNGREASKKRELTDRTSIFIPFRIHLL